MLVVKQKTTNIVYIVILKTDVIKWLSLATDTVKHIINKI